MKNANEFLQLTRIFLMRQTFTPRSAVQNLQNVRRIETRNGRSVRCYKSISSQEGKNKTNYGPYSVIDLYLIGFWILIKRNALGIPDRTSWHFKTKCESDPIWPSYKITLCTTSRLLVNIVHRQVCFAYNEWNSMQILMPSVFIINKSRRRNTLVS